MDEPADNTDAGYEDGLRKAERAFFFASVDWLKRGNREAEQLLSKPNRDTKDILAEVAAAAWKGEQPKPAEPKRMGPDLVIALTVLCHKYGEAELRAYAELLDRKGIPPSRAVKDLDKHAEVTLSEIRKHKWNPRIEMFAGLFDDGFIAHCWQSVEERICESVRDDLHGWIWFHQDGWDSPSETDAARTVKPRVTSGALAPLPQAQAKPKIKRKANALETRETRLQAFIKKHHKTIAAVRRAANVAKANMQQWRHGELSAASVMSERIENVLSGKTPIDGLGKKQG